MKQSKAQFIMDIYAEVSQGRYPSFLPRPSFPAHSMKQDESDLVRQLWNVCYIILTAEQRKQAVKQRIVRRVQRGELKIYSDVRTFEAAFA